MALKYACPSLFAFSFPCVALHVIIFFVFSVLIFLTVFVLNRYQYNPNDPGVASELRITSTRDLNLNVSVSNANTILQAYSSWNNLNRVKEPCEVFIFSPL